MSFEDLLDRERSAGRCEINNATKRFRAIYHDSKMKIPDPNKKIPKTHKEDVYMALTIQT